MKVFLAAGLILTATLASACGPRQVKVESAPKPAAEVTLRVVNNLSQAMNVYVVNGGTDMFLKQVSANSSEAIPVPGVPSGTTVTLKAVMTDGSRTYTRDNVTLSGTYDWQVP